MTYRLLSDCADCCPLAQMFPLTCLGFSTLLQDYLIIGLRPAALITMATEAGGPQESVPEPAALSTPKQVKAEDSQA